MISPLTFIFNALLYAIEALFLFILVIVLIFLVIIIVEISIGLFDKKITPWIKNIFK